MRSGGDLAGAGVLVHTFDGLEDARHPWRPCPQTGENSWCHRSGDRVSASLINANTRGLHNGARGGLVLDPKLVRSLCAYPSDGNAMHMSRSCDAQAFRARQEAAELEAQEEHDAAEAAAREDALKAKQDELREKYERKYVHDREERAAFCEKHADICDDKEEEEEEEEEEEGERQGEEEEGEGAADEEDERNFAAQQEAIKAKKEKKREKHEHHRAGDAAPTGAAPLGVSATAARRQLEGAAAEGAGAPVAFDAGTASPPSSPIQSQPTLNSPPAGPPHPPCLPGCGIESERCAQVWMSHDDRSRDAAVCFFGADELYDALQRQAELASAAAPPPPGGAAASTGPAPGQAVTAHNEVVLDAASLVEHLPASVEAFFFGTHSSPTDIQFVRAVHQKFLEEHGMKDGEPGVPPLLLLDLAPGAGDEPFSSPGPAWLGDED